MTAQDRINHLRKFRVYEPMDIETADQHRKESLWTLGALIAVALFVGAFAAGAVFGQRDGYARGHIDTCHSMSAYVTCEGVS
jgi:hypothetical protein